MVEVPTTKTSSKFIYDLNQKTINGTKQLPAGHCKLSYHPCIIKNSDEKVFVVDVIMK